MIYEGGEIAPDALVNKADGAMYAAKHEGRGRAKLVDME